ncbi:MAG: tetratricopeptide repeat protein, partial [Fimbriiglobus sp.]
MPSPDRPGRSRPKDFDDYNWSTRGPGGGPTLWRAVLAAPRNFAEWFRTELLRPLFSLLGAVLRLPLTFFGFLAGAVRPKADAGDLPRTDAPGRSRGQSRSIIATFWDSLRNELFPQVAAGVGAVARIPLIFFAFVLAPLRQRSNEADMPPTPQVPGRADGGGLKSAAAAFTGEVRNEFFPLVWGIVRSVVRGVVLVPLVPVLLILSAFRKAPADPLAERPRPMWGNLRQTPGNVALWVRYSPRWIRLVLAVSTVLSSAAVGYLVTFRMPEARKKGAVTAGWKDFEQAAREGSEDGLKKALDKILDADPTNELAAGRRKALETGEAGPSDPAITAITLRLNLRSGNMAGADREAAKRLAAEPHDWMAGNTRAYCALVAGNRDAARKHLDQLPAPDHNRSGIDPGGLLLSIRMFRDTGKSPDPLFGFIRTNILPNLSSPRLLALPAAAKTQMIECYLEPFDPGAGPPNIDGLGRGWAAIGQLADRAVDEAIAEKDVRTVATLGRTTPRLTAAVAALKSDGQVTAEQLKPLSDEIVARGKKAWQAAVELAPKEPDGYHGLAILQWQGGDYPAARQTVAKGLTTATAGPGLYALFVAMMQAESRPEVAAAAVWDAAEKHPDQPIWWTIAAEAAAAADRRDIALEGCKRARGASPNFPPAVRLEARLWLDAGDPHQALE